MRNPKMVAKMLRQFADNIENGSCGLDEQEMIEVAAMLTHRKMNIEQVCLHCGGISRATLYRRIESGKLPQPRKDPGGREYWFMDELESFLESNRI